MRVDRVIKSSENDKRACKFIRCSRVERNLHKGYYVTFSVLLELGLINDEKMNEIQPQVCFLWKCMSATWVSSSALLF